MSSDRKLHYHYTHTIYHNSYLFHLQFSDHRIFQSKMSQTSTIKDINILFLVLYIYSPKISDTYEHSIITAHQKKSNFMRLKSSLPLYSYFISQSNFNSVTIAVYFIFNFLITEYYNQEHHKYLLENISTK